MFKLSRYRYSTQFTEDGISYIDEREPFRYREDSGNRFHRVKSGDTWWGLAHLYFSGFERPAGLWWLICEYQPVPIIDPTIALDVQPGIGALVIIPSMSMIRDRVFNTSQRRYH
jgi:hypothetical protein